MRATTLSKSWRRPLSIPPNGSLTPFLFQTRTILDQPSTRPPPKLNRKDAYAASRLARYGLGVMKALNVEPLPEPVPPVKQRPSKSSQLKPPAKQARIPRSTKPGALVDTPDKRARNPRSIKAPVGIAEKAKVHPDKSTTTKAEKTRKPPKRTDDVPFEGTYTDRSERPPRSTITKAEKDAFNRLFNLVVAPSGSYKSKTERHAKWERPTAGAVEADIAESKNVEIQDEDFPEHFPEPLKRMAAEASRKVQEKEEESRLSRELEALEADRVARDRAEAERLASDPLYQQQVAQKDRIEALLSAANTDVELWNVLETELFSPTELLDLDSQKNDSSSKPVDVPTEQEGSNQSAPPTTAKPALPGVKKRKSAIKKTTREHNIAMITYIYPIVLRTALDHLTKSFPASTFPFSILPRIKRLGRTSYILGASTPLYNGIIYLTWKTYADFHRIDELLQEFDPSGLEFDGRTLEILEDIARDGKRNMGGRMGINIKLVWNMDVITGGWQKVVEWIPAVRERLEQEAARSAEESARKSAEIYEEKEMDQ